MTYIKESIYNTSLPIKVIDDSKRFSKYPQIGFGEEGSVHKYDKKTAFKVFEFFEEREKLANKFAKIEAMAHVKDKNACIPIGLVGYLNLKKEGYFTDLVEPNKACKNFDELSKLKDLRRILEYLIEADKTIERLHKRSFILGDIKGENIMINRSGEVKFVDMDNCTYGDYGFDLRPTRASWLKQIYQNDANGIDNDIFVYTVLALDSLMPGVNIKRYRNKEYIAKVIELMDTSQEVKDGLELIMSDAPHKPYLRKVLKNIDPAHSLITEESIDTLRRI